MSNIEVVKKLFDRILLSSIIFFAWPQEAVLAANLFCREVFSPDIKVVQIAPKMAKRNWSQIRTIKIMTYNVENLVWHVGKYEQTEQGLVPKFDNNRGPKEKPEEKLREIREIINEQKPDVVVLQEVESIDALEHLADEKLHSQYQSFLIQGNDKRGVNIGFLVKTDLPIFVEHISNKDVLYRDPVNQNRLDKLFSRDLPALKLMKSSQDDPFMIVLGNHAKSQRDRPGDPKSIILRTIQYQKISEIAQNYHQIYPGALILLAGDFNADGGTAKELDPVRQTMPSLFDLLKVPVSDQVTQTFHPQDGPTVFSRLDDIRIINKHSDRVLSIQVVPYKDSTGKPCPPAQCLAERNLQPSDHRPVMAEISLKN